MMPIWQVLVGYVVLFISMGIICWWSWEAGYRVGRHEQWDIAMHDAREELLLARRRELHDADRTAEPQEGAVGTARVSKARIR